MGKRSTTPSGGRGGPATGERKPPSQQQQIPDSDQPDSPEEAEQEIEQSHEEYAENVQITDNQGRRMDKRRQNVVDHLKDDFKIKDSSIYGSVLQGTMTKPLDEDSDVDVMVVLDEEKHGHWSTDPNGQRNCLRSVKNTLGKKYPNQEVYVDRNVVTVEFNDFKVEVTPALEYTHVPDPEPAGDPSTFMGFELPTQPMGDADPEEGYVIPDTYGGGSWVPTNPRQFQAIYDAVDDSHDGKLQKVAVTAKKWNERNGEPVESFHMVNMAIEYFENHTSNDGSVHEHMGEFFQNLPQFIQGETREPVYGERLDKGMSDEQRRQAAKKAWEARKKIREAERLKEEGKTEEAKEKYSDVYGDDFK